MGVTNSQIQAGLIFNELMQPVLSKGSGQVAVSLMLTHAASNPTTGHGRRSYPCCGAANSRVWAGTAADMGSCRNHPSSWAPSNCQTGQITLPCWEGVASHHGAFQWVRRCLRGPRSAVEKQRCCCLPRHLAAVPRSASTLLSLPRANAASHPLPSVYIIKCPVC